MSAVPSLQDQHQRDREAFVHIRMVLAGRRAAHEWDRGFRVSDFPDLPVQDVEVQCDSEGGEI